MSKDNPEINDIWEDKFQIRRVIYNIVDLSFERYATTCYQAIRNDPPFLYTICMSPKDFEDCKYIGKSEANLEEMFNVKK